VSCLVAVNAFGGPGRDDDVPDDLAQRAQFHPAPVGNTTVGVVVTNAALDKLGCFLLAQSAHDGLARAIFPAHTRFDGDAFVAASVGGADAAVEASIDALWILTVKTVREAVTQV
jgi:L-aminopeptidase/D-esterase-like protein